MNRHAGFTLIEALVAVVILSVGLMGLAATQAVGLRLNQSAYHRSQATLLAYDMADRIRANPVAAGVYATGTPAETVGCRTVAGCTPAQMAEQDLSEWNTSLGASLPSGTGTITVNGSIYTLRVTWDDVREAAGSVNTADTFFEVSFQTVMIGVPLKCQRGFNLVGIMISLALGIFLLAGAFQVYLSGKQTFAAQDGLSRLQENGRAALDFLGGTIRMTSYWACLARDPGDLAGTDNNAANGDDIDNGTDTIDLRGAFDPTVAATITGPCRVTKVSTGAAYYTASTSRVVYFVRDGVLFRTTEGQTDALVEGVENMQIVYGEDTDKDGSANYYVPANEVVNMDRVVAMRVTLLLRSLEDNLTAEPVPYAYNGAPTTPTDRRLRRVFTSTFSLRNRLP